MGNPDKTEQAAGGPDKAEKANAYPFDLVTAGTDKVE